MTTHNLAGSLLAELNALPDQSALDHLDTVRMIGRMEAVVAITEGVVRGRDPMAECERILEDVRDYLTNCGGGGDHPDLLRMEGL